MSGQITPDPTPRLVIPYGDRPIVTPNGAATIDMYQWMQRVNRGLGISITNIDTTVTQVNTNTTNITNIDADLTTINEELAEQQQEIEDLMGWVQVFLNSQPGPPPPPAPPVGAMASKFGSPFPPSPPRWPGAGNFIQLESHGVPEKISAMPDLDLTVTVDGAANKLAAEQSDTDNLGITLGSLYRLVASWNSFAAVNPLDGTAGNPTGDSASFTAGAAFAASGNPGQSAQFIGGAGDGAAAGGNVNLTSGEGGATGSSGHAYLFSADSSNSSPTGEAFAFSGNNTSTGDSGNAGVGTGNTDSGTSGQVFIYSGDSTSGDSGAVNHTSGNASGGTSGIVTMVSGPGASSGDVFFQTGPASAGNSGDISLQTGTATGTRGEIILDALDLWLDAAGFWSANGAVATALTSVGPTGAHTTVQEWLTVKNASGTVRYVPAF